MHEVSLTEDSSGLLNCWCRAAPEYFSVTIILDKRALVSEPSSFLACLAHSQAAVRCPISTAGSTCGNAVADGVANNANQLGCTKLIQAFADKLQACFPVPAQQ